MNAEHLSSLNCRRIALVVPAIQLIHHKLCHFAVLLLHAFIHGLIYSFNYSFVCATKISFVFWSYTGGTHKRML